MTHSWQTQPGGVTIVDGAPMVASGPAAARIEHDVIARWGELFARKAAKYGVPWWLLVGICASESWGDPTAISHVPDSNGVMQECAFGLMQITPPTFGAGTTRAQWLDPEANADRSAAILRDIIRANGLDVPKIASVYNAGGGATNTPHARASDPWGMVEDPGYIQAVVERSGYAATRPAGQPTAGAAPAPIVILGDSISQAYAPALASIADGRVRFVGRYGAGGVQTEAVPGQTVEEIRSRLSGAVQTLGRPRIVVVMAGTNDLAGKGPDGASVEAISTRMGTLLDDAHAQADETIVVQVPPITRTDLAARASWVDAYHNDVAQLVAVRRAQGWPISLVDPALVAADIQTEPGLDGVVRSGGVHPNAGGRVKIAAAVWARIVAILGAASASSGAGTSGAGVVLAVGLLGAFILGGGVHVARGW